MSGMQAPPADPFAADDSAAAGLNPDYGGGSGGTQYAMPPAAAPAAAPEDELLGTQVSNGSAFPSFAVPRITRPHSSAPQTDRRRALSWGRRC